MIEIRFHRRVGRSRKRVRTRVWIADPSAHQVNPRHAAAWGWISPEMLRAYEEVVRCTRRVLRRPEAV